MLKTHEFAFSPETNVDPEDYSILKELPCGHPLLTMWLVQCLMEEGDYSTMDGASAVDLLTTTVFTEKPLALLSKEVREHLQQCTKCVTACIAAMVKSTTTEAVCKDETFNEVSRRLTVFPLADPRKE